MTTRGAVRFFWLWLTVATGASVAGNVTHAVLSAPAATVALSAAAAVVPPAVLLGSTHSVALLVRTRPLGFAYWCALAMTVMLAGCAFVLSFDALRDLAVMLGMRPGRAWLWPCAIDVSIAQSTLALLSLTPPSRACSASRPGVYSGAGTSGETHTSGQPGGAPGRVAVQRDGVPDDNAAASPAPHASTANGEPALSAVPDAADESVDAASLLRWKPTADELVRSGVTSKDPEIVAAILAEHAAGTPPSTIGRRLEVHHSTVGRILAGAESLTG
ncbi:DUF2637 domain-containing protein [uncultured Mycobacterium sp.]|uniref:DUF2637 domain-containing protein n=1 Tax=uncultured Mycobacterium sp. TaxID=171292 RepID=UPI0035CBE550